MAIAYVNSVAASNVGSTTTTGSIDSSTGTIALVCVSYYSGASGPLAANKISDSKSNSYTALSSYIATGTIADSAVRWYYCANPTVGSGHTATVNSGGATIVAAIALVVFSGVITTSPFDVENGATPSATATTRSTGSVTPSQNDSVCVAMVQAGDSLSGIAVNGSFTLSAGVAGAPGSKFGLQTAYLIQTTATAANPQFSATAPDFRPAAIAVFKPTGGASSDQPMMRRWGGFQPVQGVGQSSGGGKRWG